MKLYRSTLLAASLAALTLLAASSVSAEGGRKLRIGFFPNITHAQPLYAKATGEYEKKTGLAVDWKAFNAGPTAIESLMLGEIDASYVGPNPAINGYIKTKGEVFQIVAGAASGGAGLVVRGDAGIDSDKSFADKIVATPQLGNTQDVAARKWFTQHDYKLKDVGGNLTIIPLANPDMLVMFQKKEIDAAWTVEPWVSRLEIEGGGKLFLDEKTLWPEGLYVTTHLVVSKKLLQSDPALVKKLVAAHVDVTQALNADKIKAQEILNEQIKKETGKSLPAEIIEASLKRIEITWDPISSSLHKSAAAAAEIGYLKGEVKLEGIYALQTLNEVLKEKGLPEVKG